MAEAILFEKPKIHLIGALRDIEDNLGVGSDVFSGIGATGCFNEKSSYELLEEHKKVLISGEGQNAHKKIDKVLDESAGRAHGSVSDQTEFVFSLENVTRATTLQLCLPEYLSHLQQSLRRATADRGFYVTETLRESSFFEETKEAIFDGFASYIKWSEADKEEDK